MFALFRLIRYKNLLIMLGTQVLAYYCFTDYLMPDDLLNSRFILLVTATLLTAASGYIINDYLDVKMDMINKPQDVIIGPIISRRWAMLLHFSFNMMAVFLASLINVKVALAVSFCVVLLWFYSTRFKKSYLTGNLMVAFMSAFVLMIIKYMNPDSDSILITAYSLFAFILSLMREIIKDAEDMQGDAKFGCRTLPIVSGIRATRRVLSALCLGLILALVIYLIFAFDNIPYSHFQAWLGYRIHLLLLVCLPLILTLFRISRADIKSHFTSLSSLCKWIMLGGLLSMIWLKF